MVVGWGARWSVKEGVRRGVGWGARWSVKEGLVMRGILSKHGCWSRNRLQINRKAYLSILFV